jgi:hypothetical protein
MAVKRIIERRAISYHKQTFKIGSKKEFFKIKKQIEEIKTSSLVLKLILSPKKLHKKTKKPQSICFAVFSK